MEEDEGARYEPLPRWGHVSVSRDGKVYVWGGRTEDFSESRQRKLASTIEIFDCKTEIWTQYTTRGIPPRGLYNAAYALQGSILYVYGGWDGQKAHNALFQLDLLTFQWTEIKPENPNDAPAEISGCGLVPCGNNKLVLFGGYGVIKEKKKKKVKKAKVDPRYALVSVGDDDPITECECKEEKRGEDEAKEEEEEEKEKEEEELTEKDKVGGDNEEKKEKVQVEKTEQMKTDRKDEETKENQGGVVAGGGSGGGLGGGDEETVNLKETGLLESVMAEIDDQKENGKAEEKEDEIKEEEGEQKHQNKQEVMTDEDSTVTHVENGMEENSHCTESKDATVKQIDVVNEHMHTKSQKAVVIKLPVSYEMDGETESESVLVVPGSSNEDLHIENGHTANEEEVKEKMAEKEVVEGKEIQNDEEKEKVEEEEDKEEEEEEENTTISVYKRSEDDPKGWTNEVKIFDLDTRMWSSQPTSGSLPPPCVDFSFTSPDKKNAVVFGGFQPPTGITFDTFLLDMETWVWTKISGRSETPSPPSSRRNPSILSHPSARDGHSACVIAGAPHPMILISGGWDASDQAVSDLWLLDINSGLWKQISGGGKEIACRFWHTVVMSQSSSRMKQLMIFGGCPGAPESHSTGSWPKMAGTILIELGQMPNMQGSFTGENLEEKWMVVDVVVMEELGDPVRRLKETLLLSSYRIQRTENLLRSMAKKVASLGIATPQTPQKKTKRVKTPVTPEKGVEKALEKRVEEKVVVVKKPFWQKATDEIQMTYEELGRGRFSVVKVAIFHETKVAARCLYSRIPSEEHMKLFTDCLELASQLRHPNLVSFIGVILDHEPIIITELMGCNLRSVLEKKALSYYQLLDVAEGVSKGLQYLHSIKPEPVIHGELTSTGVLLEDGRGPRLKAKLSDYTTSKYFHHIMTSAPSASSPDDVFSYSREHPSQEYKSRIVRRSSSSRSRSGSPLDATTPNRVGQFKKSGHTPSDAAVFSTKRDVYLFGILLVEMATRTAVLELSLHYLVESIAWTNIATLVKKCISQDQSIRPAMSDIVSQVMLLASSKP